MKIRQFLVATFISLVMATPVAAQQCSDGMMSGDWWATITWSSAGHMFTSYMSLHIDENGLFGQSNENPGPFEFQSWGKTLNTVSPCSTIECEEAKYVMPTSMAEVEVMPLTYKVDGFVSLLSNGWDCSTLNIHVMNITMGTSISLGEIHLYGRVARDPDSQAIDGADGAGAMLPGGGALRFRLNRRYLQ